MVITLLIDCQGETQESKEPKRLHFNVESIVHSRRYMPHNLIEYKRISQKKDNFPLVRESQKL